MNNISDVIKTAEPLLKAAYGNKAVAIVGEEAVMLDVSAVMTTCAFRYGNGGDARFGSTSVITRGLDANPCNRREQVRAVVLGELDALFSAPNGQATGAKPEAQNAPAGQAADAPTSEKSAPPPAARKAAKKAAQPAAAAAPTNPPRGAAAMSFVEPGTETGSRAAAGRGEEPGEDPGAGEPEDGGDDGWSEEKPIDEVLVVYGKSSGKRVVDQSNEKLQWLANTVPSVLTEGGREMKPDEVLMVKAARYLLAGN